MTWLYGPLHEHAEPVPAPKMATARERLDLEDSVRTKSILKHRTISEMLTTPGLNAASPAAETPPDHGSAAASHESSETEEEIIPQTRPPMQVTKSETALSKMNKRQSGSPPASERLFRNMTIGDKADGISHQDERRHISFNQRVDQCIAVDAEEAEEEDEDDYSDGMYDAGPREDDEGSSSDEEVLTMKSSPRTAAAWPTMASSRNSSPGLEHQTIAKLAPTILKTSDVYPAPSPQVVDPSGFSTHFSGPDGNPANRQPHLSAQPQLFQYDNQDEELAQTRYSQWDADDDFNGDFDYFNGPDVHDSYHAQASTQSSPDNDRSAYEPEQANGDTAKTNDSAPQPPRSILKRRNASDTAQEERAPIDGSGTHFSPPSSPDMVQSPASSPDKERGRSSQRVGSSASYERLQDVTRGSGAASSSGRTRSSSSNGSLYEQANAEASSSSSPPPTGACKGQHDRRESFRGRAGDGSRAMGGAAVRRDLGSSGAFDGDSDGRASLDFNSPGYPASPLLGEKDGDSDSGDEAKLYGRKQDSSRWADGRSKQSRQGDSSKLRGQSSDSTGQYSDDDARGEAEDDPAARLSVDLENLPSNAVSPPNSAQGGPTPLNTPTFALARSRSGGKRSAGHGRHASSGAVGSESSTEGSESRAPESPTLPRRSSATGALVAPSHADKDAGVRVPLAHDYVEEDEGGIVGRAVEIVNTARDLIGALLGTGGDRGRSWREAS